VIPDKERGDLVHRAETQAAIALVRCDDYEPKRVRDAVERGLALLGGAQRFVRPGERILLKPNLLAGRPPERAVTTHPAVFHAVAEILGLHGCALSYGDSPGFGNPRTIARRAGILDAAERLGLTAAEFSRGEAIAFPEGMLIKRFTLAAGVIAADGLISLPKMKTHGLTRITAAIKNQFGCIPGPLKAEFHARLPNADLFSRMLVDLNRLLRPRLFIVDGIVAMEGNGPQSGTPRPMRVLVLGDDPVAVDATLCRLIQLDPQLVLPIRYGHEAALGTATDIEPLGDRLESFVAPDFDVNRHPRSTTGQPGRLSRLARRLVVPKPVIAPERCTRCGTCVAVCPVDPKAVQFVDQDRGHPPAHQYARCIRCYCCQELCPEEAIDIDTPLLGRWIHP
jgi:uncharacterized protein (DUF362 family)/ferredoxin